MALTGRPEAGDQIVGTGGLRLIYYCWNGGPEFWLFTLYDKDEMDDLTPRQREALKQRVGRQTLRTHAMKVKPVPTLTARELAKVREDMNLSRGLLARYLRTNVRTLENWEQGRAKPNAQAALLIRMLQRFPDTVRRLAQI